MEELNTFSQIFGNGFFPVIMCAILMYGIYKFLQYHNTEIKSLTDVINKNTEAINKMAVTIQQISDRIEHLEDKMEDKVDDR